MPSELISYYEGMDKGPDVGRVLEEVDVCRPDGRSPVVYFMLGRHNVFYASF